MKQDNLINEFNAEIEKLDLPVRENIEFCQKKIKNRELEIEKLTERKNKVIEKFGRWFLSKDLYLMK